MHISFATLISAIVFATASAHATERPPRAGETAEPAQKEVAPDAQQPDKPPHPAKPATRPPLKRRSVQMTVDGMPAASPPAVYTPTLTPQLPTSSLPTPSPSSAVRAPDRPALINSCDAGGCTGTDGVRYNGGVGTTLIGPQGRPCQKNGATVQC